MMDVSIVIVSWNVRDLLADCLRSLEGVAGVSSEIIVVDSASSDGTAAFIAREFPHVRLVACEENVGFTRGNNIGIKQAEGRYIFLLNPDTVVADGAVERLAAYLDAHPEVGICAPLLLNADGSVQSSRRRLPSRGLAFFESTWLQPLAPQAMLDGFYMQDQDVGTTHDVDWVQGAALMARREVFEAIGLLDERFFMYSEELDWQHRAREAGWRVVFHPVAEVTHFGGKSSDQVKAQRDIYFHSSKVMYYRKHHGRLFGEVLRVFLLANYVWQIGVESVKGLLGHKRDMRRARVRAYMDVVKSGLKG